MEDCTEEYRVRIVKIEREGQQFLLPNKREEQNMLVKIYTDGAARGNPDGPGGYGAVLEYVDTKGELHVKELSQGYVRTTNNRMELMAVIAGLEALNRPCTVEVYSDSQYVVNAFNQHWVDGWIKKGWKRGEERAGQECGSVEELLAAKDRTM